ncbi:MAG: hypothetical protein LBM19_04720 [Holosporales bacterium]|jgi:hypothetical protein|nr:hypothetical protein [Holosporales bacterium]
MRFTHKKLLTVVAFVSLFIDSPSAAVQDATQNAMQARLEKLEQTNKQLIELLSSHVEKINDLTALILKMQVQSTREGLEDIGDRINAILTDFASRGFILVNLPDGSWRILNKNEIGSLGENKTQIGGGKSLSAEEQLALRNTTDQLTAEYKKSPKTKETPNAVAR